ncbi:hypothetical protein KEM56_000685 [Ascosphaera pollenicola]|nr:hypothetical protein KEM56_000685 [Ascosphaera pollenicola]
MVLPTKIVAGAGLLNIAAAATIPPLKANRASSIKPKYRISPLDGSRIALPTKSQLEFQDREIGVLIHYNIATYIDEDGCNFVPRLVPNVDLFDPQLINTDQWMDSIRTLGGRYATLVAKHNCGFNLWPSEVTFENRDNQTVHYNYTIAGSPKHGMDLVRNFVDSTERYGVGHGFYYSVVVNNFLKVAQSRVLDDSLEPGQVAITNSTYDQIVLDQLTELWTNYGKLTEIRSKIFLRGYSLTLPFSDGCDEIGTCLTSNPIRWIGTEEGHAPEETWSTGLENDGGDPGSEWFAPAECDTTLQKKDRWFFGMNATLRSYKEMVDIYHRTVGHNYNCVLELDLTPDRSGLIPAEYAARYKQLGNFIRSCYGKPATDAMWTQISQNGSYHLHFTNPTPIDRIQLMEDQTNGQVIRAYQVLGKVVDATTLMTLSEGTGVGHKKIDLFKKPVTVTELVVKPTKFVDTPKWRAVSVHLCDRY